MLICGEREPCSPQNLHFQSCSCAASALNSIFSVFGQKVPTHFRENADLIDRQKGRFNVSSTFISHRRIHAHDVADTTRPVGEQGLWWIIQILGVW